MFGRKKNSEPKKEPHSDSDRYTTRFERSVYIGAGITSFALILIGIIIKLSYKADPSFFSDLSAFFFGEFGVALFIAVFLVFTIEHFSRQRHEKAAKKLLYDVSDDLFHAVYHRYVPPLIFSEVEKCLLTSRVYRTNYEIDYALNYITDEEAERHGITKEDQNTHLCVSVYSEYTLKNTTKRPEKTPVEAHFELPIDPQMRGFY